MSADTPAKQGTAVKRTDIVVLFDLDGLPYIDTSSGLARVSPCCNAITTFVDDELCCKACYAEAPAWTIQPVRLEHADGGAPTPEPWDAMSAALTTTPWLAIDPDDTRARYGHSAFATRDELHHWLDAPARGPRTAAFSLDRDNGTWHPYQR